MSTNEFLKTTKKKSDDFVFKIIVPVFGLLIVIFNPISIFILSVLGGTLLYIIVFRKTIFRKLFFLFLTVIYIILLFIYSVSPKIQYVEFKTTHPDWVEVEGDSLHVEVSWQGGKSRKSTADITYQYRINNKIFSKTENRALKNNTYSVFWNSENEKKESNLALKNRVETYIRQKNFKILKNPASEETQLFIPLDNILFSSSFGTEFIVTISKVMSVPFFFILIFFFWNGKGFKNLKE
ncbi:hypothetical protein [Chryseobacterium sp. UNC8MFCol]|uniref:hypothetical protein n=1 Tax=Chryseobacterium sp. UNC8MFCol TaxID=1340435 RepID=UPI00047F4CF3|nr:hypothetical protein [Chryseobacterium sp. UNC8MFCol]